MGLDRFVHWKKHVPSKNDIEKILNNFFHAIHKKIWWSKDRFIVELPGDPTYIFNGVSDEREDLKLDKVYKEGSSRFLEIWIAEDCIDIITRSGDELTNSLANELARRISLYYQAELDI